MSSFSIFVNLLLTVKSILIGLVIILIYLKHIDKPNANIEMCKDITEFIFKFLMALLLIYVFNPNNSKLNLIDKRICTVLFMFGFIVIILDEKWELFLNHIKTLLNYIRFRWAKYPAEVLPIIPTSVCGLYIYVPLLVV